MNKKICIALFLLSASCAATKPISPEYVTPDYKTFGGEWDEDGSLTVVVTKIFNQNGKVALCGGYASKGNKLTLEEVERDLIEESYLIFNDKRIITGLSFFNDFGSDIAFKNKKANCVITEISWKPHYNPDTLQLELPNSFKPKD